MMKSQRNTEQMKEKKRNTEVQINEGEIGEPPGKEFRIMIVKMIKNLENKMEKLKNQLTKTQENLRINMQTNNTITEIKNTLEGINSRVSKQKNESVSWKIKWWK